MFFFTNDTAKCLCRIISAFQLPSTEPLLDKNSAVCIWAYFVWFLFWDSVMKVLTYLTCTEMPRNVLEDNETVGLKLFLSSGVNLLQSKVTSAGN